jgi:hypothetical protein
VKSSIEIKVTRNPDAKPQRKEDTRIAKKKKKKKMLLVPLLSAMSSVYQATSIQWFQVCSD